MVKPNKLSRNVLLLTVIDGAQSVHTSKGDLILSSGGISSSLLSQIAGSPLTDNRLVIDLNQLAQNVQSGSFYLAEYDYVTLSEDALNGSASSTATTSASEITTNLPSEIASSSGSSTLVVGELNQLGTNLQSGDPASAQQDLLAPDSTALNAASSAGESSSGTTSMTNSAAPATEAGTIKLVYPLVQGMESGENSVASSAVPELASMSPSSAGASAFAQERESFGSSSGSTFNSSSSSQLLRSLNTSLSTSGLSLFA